MCKTSHYSPDLSVTDVHNGRHVYAWAKQCTKFNSKTAGYTHGIVINFIIVDAEIATIHKLHNNKIIHKIVQQVII